MSALLAHLADFASGDEKVWHAKPLSLKIGRSVWTVGTDGLIMFAMKMDGGAEPNKKAPLALKDLLKAPAADPVQVSTARLKAWAGPVPPGRIPDGEVDAEHCGNLIGNVIDRRKLAYLISRVNLPKVNVWAREGHFLCIEPSKKQWRAAIACLRGAPDGDEPVFPPKKQQDEDGPSVEDLADMANKMGSK